MLAIDRPQELTRLSRARIDGKHERAQPEDVPVGVAALTDQVPPHVSATPDAEIFAA